MTDITILSPSDLRNFSDFDSHQKIIHARDEASGLDAYIGIHNTSIGPALGGCRMFAYAGAEDAIRDVLRLSRGMTYKNALAGLPLGGGKSVIIGDARTQKTEAMMIAMGRAVEAMRGDYITAEDSGTGEHDMEAMSRETSYVVGIPVKGSDLGGNPSPVTAYGVYNGLKSAAKRRYNTDDLKGMAVSVQGLGAVGYELCRLLHRDGVSLNVTDIRPAQVEKAVAEFGAVAVDALGVYTAKAHIFAPCALGGGLNDETVPLLNVDIVAGAANNQLARAQHQDMLADRHIMYVPDYVLNAGGVIAVFYEYALRTGCNPFAHELNRKNMLAHVEGIGPTIAKVFNIADARGITPARAADEMAEAIFMSPTDKNLSPERRASGG